MSKKFWNDLIKETDDMKSIIEMIDVEETNTCLIAINHKKLDEYLKIINSLKKYKEIDSKLTIDRVFSIPDIIDSSSGSSSISYKRVLSKYLNEAIDDLISMRLKEGKNLSDDIRTRLNKINKNLGLIVKNSQKDQKKILRDYKKKIKSLIDKNSKIMAHLVRAQMPFSFDQLKRLDRSIESVDVITKGKFDEYGQEFEFGDEFQGLFGFRAVKVNPDRAMNFKVADYQKGVRDSRSLFTRVALKGGPIEPREVVDAYINANRALFDVKKTLKGDMDAARLLNISVT